MAADPSSPLSSTTTLIAATTTASTTSTTSTIKPFPFPASHSFPPLYTLQPNPVTREAQFRKWSRTMQAYCRHHGLFTLTLPECLELDLFRNQRIRRRLREQEVRAVVGWMVSDAGGRRTEWKHEDHPATATAGGGAAIRGGRGGAAGERTFYVYWRRPEEWADAIYAWIEDTGQKGAVLTVWEMLEGEATAREKWHRMDADLVDRALQILVRRG